MANMYNDGGAGKKKPEMPIRPGGLPKVKDPNAPSKSTGNSASSSNISNSGGQIDTAETPQTSGEGLYNRLMRQQQQALEGQRRAQQNAANEQAGYLSDRARGAAADSRTNQYIYNAIANRDMGQQASMLGLGGLTESSVMGQNTTYQNALANVDKQLNQDLGEIETSRAQAEFAAEKDYGAQQMQLSQQQAQNELQRMLAVQKAGSGGSGGRNTADEKNEISVSLATQLYKEGNRSKGVMDALRKYNLVQDEPDFYPNPQTPNYNETPGMPTSGAPMYKLSLYTNLQNMMNSGNAQSAISAIANAAEKGILTAQEVMELRRKYGI